MKKVITFLLYIKGEAGVNWQVEGKLTPDEQDMLQKEGTKIYELIKGINEKLNKNKETK